MGLESVRGQAWVGGQGCAWGVVFGVGVCGGLWGVEGCGVWLGLGVVGCRVRYRVGVLGGVWQWGAGMG